MPSRRRIQLAVPLVTLIAGVRSRENHHCSGAAHRAVGNGLATARFLGTSSPKIIDTDVAISSANASAMPSTMLAGMPIAVSGACSSVRDDGFGQVTGGQRRDRDAELGAGELEGQRAVRLLDERVAPAAGLGVGVDGAAFQRGQRELGGDEHRRSRRQQQEGEQAEERGSSEPRTTGAGHEARLPTGGFGVGWLRGGPVRRFRGLGGCLRHVFPFDRRRDRTNRSRGQPPCRPTAGGHQPDGSGCPSAKPAADCTPRTTLSCSSGSVAAPT